MTPDAGVFADLKHHPRVCSNCFRLRHDVDPVPDSIERLAKRTYWADAVTERWTRTEHAHQASPPTDEPTDRPVRTVCECGNFSAFSMVYRSPDDPLDKQTAIDYAGHLSDTLEVLAREAADHGDDDLADRFAHDADALYDAVRYLKSQPERQFNDDFIFEAAVRVACNR